MLVGETLKYHLLLEVPAESAIKGEEEAALTRSPKGNGSLYFCPSVRLKEKITFDSGSSVHPMSCS